MDEPLERSPPVEEAAVGGGVGMRMEANYAVVMHPPITLNAVRLGDTGVRKVVQSAEALVFGRKLI